MINKNRDNMKRLAMKYGANNFLMSRKFSQMKDYILNNMTEKNSPEFYMMVLQDESVLEKMTNFLYFLLKIGDKHVIIALAKEGREMSWKELL